MLLEYILKKNNIDCKKSVEIVQNIVLVQLLQLLRLVLGTLLWNLNHLQQQLSQKIKDTLLLRSA